MASRTGALAIGPAAALVYIGSHVGQEAVDRVLREATRAVWHRRAAKSPSRCELTDRSAVAATASSAGSSSGQGPSPPRVLDLSRDLLCGTYAVLGDLSKDVRLVRT